MSSHRDSRRRSRSRSRSRDRSRRDRSRSRSRERRYKDSDRDRRRSRSPHRHRDRDGDRHRGQEREEYRPSRRDEPRERSPQRGEPPRPPPPLKDTPPERFSIHKGTVVNIRPFGVFVAIPGYRKHVLVHHSQLSDEIRFSKDDDDETKVKSMEFFLPKGAPAYVKITEVAPDPHTGDLKCNGTMRVVDQETGEDLDPGNTKLNLGGGGGGHKGPLSDMPPEEGTVHRGTVKRIEPYGVFVALEGYRKFGLVHSSQVSNFLSFSREDSDEQKKAELSGVVSIGEAVYVKVVEVIEDDGSGRGPKIQCSIKLVDQKTGEDLDPMGTRYKPRGSGEGRPGGPGGIGSNAGEVVGGKIDWGHMAGDAKLYVGDQGAQYKMLDDPDKGRLPGPPPLPPGGLAPGNILTSTGRPLELLTGQGQHGGGPMHEMLLPSAPPPPKITSVEEALAIIEQATKHGGKKKRDKKDKKEKKKKDKSSKKKKEKSKKDKRRGSSSSESSDSD